MLPYYKWTLRLWCFDINWKNKGINRLEIEFLSRKRFVGKYQFKFFFHK